MRASTAAGSKPSSGTLEGTRLKHFEVVRTLGRGGMRAPSRLRSEFQDDDRFMDEQPPGGVDGPVGA